MTRYDPDILAKGLDVVFCGVNPGSTAAAAGHNFSNAKIKHSSLHWGLKFSSRAAE